MDLLLLLSLSSLLLLSPLSSTAIPTTTTTTSDTIQRSQPQQFLATIPPTSPQPTQPFLTSPSATYTAFLRRDNPAFCYLQIQETATGKTVWNSECTQVSPDNACALAFADIGLELYDGSHSVWDTGLAGAVNGNDDGANYNNNYYLSALTLDDEGDMKLLDSAGEPVWKSSGETQASQECGLPVSPYGQNGQQSSGMVLSPPPATTGDEIVQPPSPATGDLPDSPEMPLVPPPVAASISSSPASAPAFETPLEGGGSSGVGGGSSGVGGGSVGGGGGVGVGGGVNGNHPFGQQQLQGGNGLNQPLVDNNAYDSGSSRKEGVVMAMEMGLVIVGLFVHGFGL